MIQVDFEVNIITSFEGVTLEVGGDVETYWKSMAMPVVSMPQASLSRWSHRSSLIGSAHTSPSVSSTNNLGGQAALTVSSLHGCYVFAVVQVTRDFHPVVYSEWLLPGTDYDLGVSDVTLKQFQTLSHRLGRHIHSEDSVGIKDWSSSLSRSMISLADLLKVRAKSCTFDNLIINVSSRSYLSMSILAWNWPTRLEQREIAYPLDIDWTLMILSMRYYGIYTTRLLP